MAQNIAKSRGFSDVLYLDSESKKNLEEVSSCNIFIAKVLLNTINYRLYLLATVNLSWISIS